MRTVKNIHAVPDGRVGVDVGGTFTDYVYVRDGRLTIHKRLTTPEDVAGGLLAGLEEMGAAAASEIVHGSTVATNALLERKGARTALVTTKGFADVLEIGRQNRPELYALTGRRPPPLVPAELRFEVDERMDATGAVLRPLDPASLHAAVEAIRRAGAESVAVVLLFSFLNPAHERAVGAALEQLGIPVSLSCEVLPEYREYERTSTLVANAYVAPLVSRYLRRLADGLASFGAPASERTLAGQRTGSAQPRRSLRIIQSNGGSISAAVAAALPVRTVLSGPAGGVVGAFHVARLAGFTRVITFDMGGTSTDVSLCDGAPQHTTEFAIGGMPVRVPVIDIHTVGAGGGSIARLDAGGALRVGPESAGARPGPVAYGRGGTEPTVTDANVVLGRLPADRFLGGRMLLDAAAARQALEALGRRFAPPGEDAALAAARGVIRVVNSNMERAIRVISVERGHDPRRFTLVAFGGAGPLHACELAQALGIPRVLVPLYPGVLSAVGMLVADIMRDYSQTVLLRHDGAAAALQAVFAALEDRARRDAAEDGLAVERLRLRRALDLRYAGQSFEITVPLDTPRTEAEAGEALARAVARFHRAHRRRFAHAHPDRPVEIVTARLSAIYRTPKPAFERLPLGSPDASAALIDRRPVAFAEGMVDTAIYERALLAPGNRFDGPAIVTQFDATTVVPPGWTAQVDGYRNLVLTMTRL
jgi:N-methylhydantoinase A